MISSMTGFGRELLEYQGKKISIDVKTLNSKSADISTRLPLQYKEKDIEIRRLLMQGLLRGKIDFTITVENDQDSNLLNTESIIYAYNKLVLACKNSNIPLDKNADSLLSSIIRFPEMTQNVLAELDSCEWAAIEKGILNAINRCNAYRIEEGRILSKDILSKIDKILSLLEQIPQYEAERVPQIKERLRQSISELGVAGENSDNRLEQEIIFYLEKLDINEEKVRLKKHCEYFIETATNEDNSGRKLGFIAQEMGREINTLGSKAHHVEMQKIVVMMKDELEKIKEQSLNIL